MRRRLMPQCRTRLITLALLLVAALAASACGSVAEVPATATDALTGDATDASVPPDEKVIRLALPPEPLWQWLVDSGTLAAWELEHGARIEASHPFRPFTAIVSGHADIILVDALDVPVFALDFEHQPVIIGKYASDRSIAATKRTSSATDLAGVVEGRIAMESQLGSTLLWALIAESRHSLQLRYGSPDFEFVIATSGIADTVERGDADACICQPEETVEQLGTGALTALYDGKPAGKLYAEILGRPSQLPMGQVFLADGEFRQLNPEIITEFLALWELAIQHWHQNFPEMIAGYPELLSVQTQDEIEWLTAYVALHNWIAPTIYADDADRQIYEDAISLLMDTGHVPRYAQVPQLGFRTVDGASGNQQHVPSDAADLHVAAHGPDATNGGQ